MKFGSTGLSYTKRKQLGWRRVSEDGDLVVKIHKQLGCRVPNESCLFLCLRTGRDGSVIAEGTDVPSSVKQIYCRKRVLVLMWDEG